MWSSIPTTLTNGSPSTLFPRPKRQKIEVACNTCRLRKTRCDGGRPSECAPRCISDVGGVSNRGANGTQYAVLARNAEILARFAYTPINRLCLRTPQVVQTQHSLCRPTHLCMNAASSEYGPCHSRLMRHTAKPASEHHVVRPRPHGRVPSEHFRHHQRIHPVNLMVNLMVNLTFTTVMTVGVTEPRKLVRAIGF